MKPRKPRSPGPRRDNQSSSFGRQGGGSGNSSSNRQRPQRYDSDALQRSRGLSIHTMDQSVINAFETTETLTGRRAKGPHQNQNPQKTDIRAEQRAEGRRMAAYSDDEFDDNVGNRAPGAAAPQERTARGPRDRGPGRDRSIKVWRPEGENEENAAPSRDSQPREYQNRDSQPREYQNRDSQPRGPRSRGPRDYQNRDAQSREQAPREQAPREGGAENGDSENRESRYDRQNKNRNQRAPGSGLHRSRRRFQRQDEVANGQPGEEQNGQEKPSNAQRKEETRIHGVNACRAFFDQRKGDLIRVYLTQERSYEFNDVMKHCVENRLAYHIIPADELARAAESEHHEGVCFLIRKRVTLQLDEWLMTLPKKGGVRAIALDQIGNSHNIGAILRNAAHFGVDAVLFSANAPIHNGSAARTAEGGFETLTLVEYRDSLAAIQALKTAGFDIVATTGDGDSGLYDQKLPKRAVIFFGEEKSGLPQPLIDAADLKLSIPGSGAVQSLNVASASAVILGEWSRTTTKKKAASTTGGDAE